LAPTSPRARPDRPLDLAATSAIALVVPSDDEGSGPATSHLAVPLRRGHPVAEAAARRARYVWFDYGPWADLYDAPVTSEEAMSVLLAARRPPVTEVAVEEEVHDRFSPERAFVRYAVPRPGEPPPWRASPAREDR
jgi:hypothetical protein